MSIHQQFGIHIATSVNINRLEAVQRSATQICYKDFSRYLSVSVILISPLFTVEEPEAKLLMLYKIIINHSVAIQSDCLTPVYPSLRSGYLT